MGDSGGVDMVATAHEVLDRLGDDPRHDDLRSEARELLAVFRGYERGEVSTEERRHAISRMLSCYSKALGRTVSRR